MARESLERRLTIAELAEETNMSEAFWRKQVLLKTIEIEKFGRSVRVTESALRRYLTARTPLESKAA
jgi:excisionase family DNA binding protein